MQFVSKAPAEHFNCSTAASTTASVNSLCGFMDTNRIARDLHNQMKSMFHGLDRSVLKQREWIAATFSGHPQAAAVLAVVNISYSLNCQLAESGLVTC